MFLPKKLFSYSSITSVGTLCAILLCCNNGYASEQGELEIYMSEQREEEREWLNAGELQKALYQADYPKARRLLNSETNVNIHAADPSGWTLLTRSVQSAEAIDITEWLLRAGADVHATTSDGLPPIMVAAIYSNARGVRLLARWGARVNDSDFNGHTVLQKARSHSANTATITALQQRGAIE